MCCFHDGDFYGGLMGFNGDFGGIIGDVVGFNADFMVILWEMMILWWFDDGLMNIWWDSKQVSGWLNDDLMMV